MFSSKSEPAQGTPFGIKVLSDLVSFNQKHNEANGEHNCDGINDNLSWNCGAEGNSDDPNINLLRNRQVRNFAAILLLSRGVPMFVAGDEIRRSQKGNNNAYCQDNEISWFDWTFVKEHAELFRFWKMMIRFRKMREAIRLDRFFNGSVNERDLKDVSWHGHETHPSWIRISHLRVAWKVGVSTTRKVGK